MIESDGADIVHGPVLRVRRTNFQDPADLSMLAKKSPCVQPLREVGVEEALAEPS